MSHQIFRSHRFVPIAAAVAFAFSATAAEAACEAGMARDAMTYGDAQKVYDCLKDELQANYLKGDKRWIPREFVEQYRTWTPASTLPANPGVHGERYLFTYVNDIGAAAYLEFKDEGAKMPEGTLIAKESFSIDEKGKASQGPLFFMRKVGAGVSPETSDWYYFAVAANGTPMAVDVITACNACHAAFEGSDQLGYPEEDVRASK